MSHFVCMVITDSTPTQELLKAAMQPFHEYECTGIKDEYVVFIDESAEAMEDWSKEVEVYQTKTGEIIEAHDKSLYRPATPEEVEIIGDTSTETPFAYRGVGNGFGFENIEYHVLDVPSSYTKINIPRSELPGNKELGLEAWAADWSGLEVVDGKLGRYTNPNRQWDWWVVGGRWSDMLTDIYGNHGDASLVGDLDLAAMKDANIKPRVESINRVISEIGLPEEDVIQDWARYCDEVIKMTELWEETDQSVRKWDWMKANSEFITQCEEVGITKLDSYFGVKVPTTYKDPYKWAHSAPALSAWAVLKDGVWSEKGSMGWFGMSSATEEDELEWEDKLRILLDTLPEDHYITIVDCHI